MTNGLKKEAKAIHRHDMVVELLKANNIDFEEVVCYDENNNYLYTKLEICTDSAIKAFNGEAKNGLKKEEPELNRKNATNMFTF